METKPKICDRLMFHGLRTLKITLLLFTSLYFISSCTVQKRKYRKGIYLHVNSNQNSINSKLAVHGTKEANPSAESTMPKEHNEVAGTKPGVKIDSLIRLYFKASGSSNTPTSNNPLATRIQLQPVLRHYKNLIKEARIENKQRVGTEPKRKLLIGGLIGMILSILSLVSIPIGIVMLLISNGSGVFVIFLGILLFLISFILNLIALIKKSVNPQSYRGEAMAIIGMVFDLLLIFIYFKFIQTYQL